MRRGGRLGQIDVDPPLPQEVRRRLSSRLTHWSVCVDGCCLNLVGEGSADELRATIASLSTVHRFTGMVVSESADGELTAIRVANRRVYEKVLQPPRSRAARIRRPVPRKVVRLDERRRARP